MAAAYLLSPPGLTPYDEALALQRTLSEAVKERAMPDTVILLEHEPVITLGRRTDEATELHLPDDVAVPVVETNRGGKSTFHGPGQLVCYPILDLNRHGRDLKRYVRDLEEAIIQTVAAFGIVGERVEGMTGVWTRGVRGGQTPSGSDPMKSDPRKLASIGVHASRWVTTHGYALNVDLDPAPFTEWITACGLEDAQFTTMALELGHSPSVEDVRPSAARAIADGFGLRFDELSVDELTALVGEPVAR